MQKIDYAAEMHKSMNSPEHKKLFSKFASTDVKVEEKKCCNCNVCGSECTCKKSCKDCGDAKCSAVKMSSLKMKQVIVALGEMSLFLGEIGLKKSAQEADELAEKVVEEVGEKLSEESGQEEDHEAKVTKQKEKIESMKQELKGASDELKEMSKKMKEKAKEVKDETSEPDAEEDVNDIKGHDILTKQEGSGTIPDLSEELEGKFEDPDLSEFEAGLRETPSPREPRNYPPNRYNEFRAGLKKQDDLRAQLSEYEPLVGEHSDDMDELDRLLGGDENIVGGEEVPDLEQYSLDTPEIPSDYENIKSFNAGGLEYNPEQHAPTVFPGNKRKDNDVHLAFKRLDSWMKKYATEEDKEKDDDMNDADDKDEEDNLWES